MPVWARAALSEAPSTRVRTTRTVRAASGMVSHGASTQAVSGYHVQAIDGIIGHVCDFMMDDKGWAIGQLVVKIGHRFTGNEVLIAVSDVVRISYDDSTIFVNLTKDAVEKSPAYHLAPLGAANLESIVL